MSWPVNSIIQTAWSDFIRDRALNAVTAFLAAVAASCLTCRNKICLFMRSLRGSNGYHALHH